MAETKKFKYENTSESEQALIGFGSVKPGKTIETDEPVHNANFKLVGGDRLVNVERPTEQPSVKNGIIKSKNK